MYPLTPSKVYVLERAMRDPACVTRMERLLGGLANRPPVVTITEGNLPEVVQELSQLWPPAELPPGQVRSFTRPLVLTTMDLSYRRTDLGPLLARCPPETSRRTLAAIYGHMTTAVDQHPYHLDQRQNCVCWPTYNFGTMIGCPHGCQYCGAGRAGKYIAVALNLEAYMEQVVRPVIEANPWNKVYRMILDGADLITFEPEYGLFDLFTRVLAEYEGRWGHFHTSSSNVEWLADLEHRDQLVGVWSVTCEAAARAFEPGTGAAIDRFEAARKCQEMGIPVRFKFKPTIPVVNWRDEYASMIERALAITRPESIGFALYMWNSYETMAATLGTKRLDPAYVQAAYETRDEMAKWRCGPFPHPVRQEVYRFLIGEVRRWDRDALLYVSTETREMWDELKDELGQDPLNYVCACSSVAVPGRKLALSPAFRYSTYHPTPL